MWAMMSAWQSLPALRLAILVCLPFVYPFLILGNDSLFAGDSITSTQTLISAGSTFQLGFFSTQRSNASSPSYYLGIWYKSIPDSKVVWVANRQTPIVGSLATTFLNLTPSGDLMITNGGATSQPLWSAGMRNLAKPIARLKDDGNLVILASSEDGATTYTAWQSFDHPTDTLLPGMKLGRNRRTGMNYSLISWSGPEDPSPGEYTLTFDIGEPPQIAIYTKGWIRLCRSIPSIESVWNSYLPGNVDALIVNTAEDLFYSYQMSNNPQALMRLVLNYSTGGTERWVWAPVDGDGWTRFNVWPNGLCDYWGRCGEYGICDPMYNQQSSCRCIPGFKPKNPGEWERGVWRSGCVRRTELDCRPEAATTDGFLRISAVKPPDTMVAAYEKGRGKAQCRAACMSNCSCMGYMASQDGGSGSWCMMWSGELIDVQTTTDWPDLYVRVAHADADGDEDTHQMKYVLGIITGCIGFAVLLSVASYLIWRQNSRGKCHTTVSNMSKIENCDLPSFDLSTILDATKNFSRESILGKGGFGDVYKAMLHDGQEVAVKRLSNHSMQGQEEFRNEVMLIGKLQHKNLVRLLGYCIDNNEKILIYEYMERQSLDFYLFDKNRSMHLDWQARYRIIQGIARGLLYLHNDSRLRIIHRDLKAANILLNENMEPKISDFGMARVFDMNQIDSKTKRVVGTYGYMSPEYALDGVFSMKSDVFSFGVLVLEIVSGVKNKAIFHISHEDHLLGQAWSLWNEDKGLQILDPSIDPPSDILEALTCIEIGLLCVQEQPDDRPTMSSVVTMLGNLNPKSLPMPKKPGYATKFSPLKMEIPHGEDSYQCVHDMTLTISKGR